MGVKKVLAFFHRSVVDHPFLLGVLIFFSLLYRFSPALFSFLVSNSPVIVCTAVLLGTLLSFGNPHIPDIIVEEKRQEIFPLVLDRSGDDDHVVIEKDREFGFEDTPLLVRERIENIETEDEDEDDRAGHGSKDEELDVKEEESKSRIEFYVGDDDHLSSRGFRSEVHEASTKNFASRDIGSANFKTVKDENELGVDHAEKPVVDQRVADLKSTESIRGVLSSENLKGILANGNRGMVRTDSKKSVRFVVDGVEKSKEEKKEEEDVVETRYEDNGVQIGHEDDEFGLRVRIHGDPYAKGSFGNDEEEDDDDDEDDLSGTDSERAESSSPDASMSEILPMLDELDPLIDSEKVHHENALRRTESMEFDDEDEDDDDEEDEDDNDNGEGGDGFDSTKKTDDTHEEGSREQGELKKVEWTEDDTKNVMVLGCSEIERNRRLESLMAKRRARKMFVEERNLIDLDSDDKPYHEVPVKPVMTRMPTFPLNRRNPFDFLNDDNDEPDPWAGPVSARARETLPRRSPFDLPDDHEDIDIGETSNEGDILATHQDGLYVHVNDAIGESAVYSSITRSDSMDQQNPLPEENLKSETEKHDVGEDDEDDEDGSTSLHSSTQGRADEDIQHEHELESVGSVSHSGIPVINSGPSSPGVESQLSTEVLHSDSEHDHGDFDDEIRDSESVSSDVTEEIMHETGTLSFIGGPPKPLLDARIQEVKVRSLDINVVSSHSQFHESLPPIQDSPQVRKVNDSLSRQTSDTEPVFDSSPSALDKARSDLASIAEAELFMDHGIVHYSSVTSDARIEMSEFYTSESSSSSAEDDKDNDEYKYEESDINEEVQVLKSLEVVGSTSRDISEVEGSEQPVHREQSDGSIHSQIEDELFELKETKVSEAVEVILSVQDDSWKASSSLSAIDKREMTLDDVPVIHDADVLKALLPQVQRDHESKLEQTNAVIEEPIQSTHVTDEINEGEPAADTTTDDGRGLMMPEKFHMTEDGPISSSNDTTKETVISDMTVKRSMTEDNNQTLDAEITQVVDLSVPEDEQLGHARSVSMKESQVDSTDGSTHEYAQSLDGVESSAL